MITNLCTQLCVPASAALSVFSAPACACTDCSQHGFCTRLRVPASAAVCVFSAPTCAWELKAYQSSPDQTYLSQLACLGCSQRLLCAHLCMWLELCQPAPDQHTSASIPLLHTAREQSQARWELRSQRPDEQVSAASSWLTSACQLGSAGGLMMAALRVFIVSRPAEACELCTRRWVRAAGGVQDSLLHLRAGMLRPHCSMPLLTVHSRHTAMWRRASWCRIGRFTGMH